MRKKTVIISIIITLILSLGGINITKADEPSWPGWEINYPWGQPEPKLPSYVNSIYKAAFWVGGFVAVLMIIIGGVQWMSSAASPQQKRNAKDRITKATVGFVTLFAIFVILNTINPEIIELKEPEVSEYTPQYDFSSGGGRFNVFGRMQEDVAAQDKGVYDSYNEQDQLPGESKEPCECAGTKGGEDNRCGTYCFHACRRYVALKNNSNNINPKVYGVIGNCYYGTDYDRVECRCYEAENEEFSEAVTIELPNACEVSGDKEPKCVTSDSEYCYDYCKDQGYKFGYISRREPGSGLDLVWCTCFR